MSDIYRGLQGCIWEYLKLNGGAGVQMVIRQYKVKVTGVEYLNERIILARFRLYQSRTVLCKVTTENIIKKLVGAIDGRKEKIEER